MKRENLIRKFIRMSLSLIAAAVFSLGFGATHRAQAQSLDSFDRERGRMMLSVVKNEIKKNYYDPTFHGIDLDERCKAAEEKIKQATSNGQVFGIIAQVLLDLEDSHTHFYPPERAARVEYGWQMQIIGNKCYVVAVKPGSDAEAKGLKVGDAVRKVAGYEPTRDNLWKMLYLFYSLRPQPGLRVDVQSPDGQQRQLDLLAKVDKGKRLENLTGYFADLISEISEEDRLYRQRYFEMGDELFVWKMPRFDQSETEVDEMMSKVKKHKALILDLRGNPGGYVVTLQRLLGHFFERDVKIGDVKGRKETKPLMAKSRGRAFDGQLIVLVDSKSGSAAEVFARTVQLEKRGTIIGDRTAGAVMTSKFYSYSMGLNTVILYGASITESDLIMPDGKSIEKVGVTPDELLLPTAADLAAKRDPVLSRAVELAGKKMESERAGTLFPIEWRK